MPGWVTSEGTQTVPATELCVLDEQAVSHHPLPIAAKKNLKIQKLKPRFIPDAEALQVTFDPDQLTYNTLLEFFYRMHDPTTKNRQGGDAGTQYRSGIFTHTPEQATAARVITDHAQKQWWTHGTISTEILEAGTWWDAEDYHQLYLDKNPGGYECPAHYLRKFPDLKEE